MPAHPEATAAKHALRQRCLSALRAVPEEQRERFSAALRARLRPLLPEKNGANIAIYAPLPHEVDLLPLFQEQPGYSYLFPFCLPGGRLQFRHVTDPAADLVAGAHGIRAPRESCPAVPPEEIDLIVVPGVAFTATGKRLGYGGGFYDRFLPQCARARILALAFPVQILDSLPTEPHDLTIPLVLTP